MVSNSLLVKGWANISNVSYLRVQAMLQVEMADDFMTISDHKLLIFDDFVEKWFIKLMGNLKKLFKSYGGKTWTFIWAEFTSLYIQMVIFKSAKWKPEELKKLVAKVDGEIITMCNIFKDYVGDKDFSVHENKLQAIKGCFKDPAEQLIKHIGKLYYFIYIYNYKVFLGSLYVIILMQIV